LDEERKDEGGRKHFFLYLTLLTGEEKITRLLCEKYRLYEMSVPQGQYNDRVTMTSRLSPEWF